MTDCFSVSCTTETREEAEKIAERLVAERLVACVHITGPITSIYRWDDQVERAEEWLLLIKTTSGAYLQVERAIFEMHSYNTPEIAATEIVAGSEKYLNWLRESVAEA